MKMGFFDELGDGISEATKDVGGKAKELGITAKLHGNIKVEELKVQEQYYKLGKAYYALYRETADVGLLDFVDAIDKSNEEILALKQELENLKK